MEGTGGRGEPLPIQLPEFKRLEERGGRERGEGCRDLDKMTEVRIVTVWLGGRQCMLGVIGNTWS